MNLRRKRRGWGKENEGKAIERLRFCRILEIAPSLLLLLVCMCVLIPNKLEQLSSERIKNSQENQGAKRQRQEIHNNFSALMCFSSKRTGVGEGFFTFFKGEKLSLRIKPNADI